MILIVIVGVSAVTIAFLTFVRARRSWPIDASGKRVKLQLARSHILLLSLGPFLVAATETIRLFSDAEPERFAIVIVALVATLWFWRMAWSAKSASSRRDDDNT